MWDENGGERMRELICGAVFLATISLSGCLLPEDYGSTQSPIANDDCTLTQGYWKNHPKAWPVQELKLGSVTYTKAQALTVFGQPVNGNGLVSLAHQLMASKLNVAAGATDAVGGAIAQADAKIGALTVPTIGKGWIATTDTASLVQTLDQYNIGNVGPGHCDGVGPAECICGDGAVHVGETCDDGNTIDGDGCSSHCQLEVIQ
jgi:cysteine-rich repeat protein